MSNTASKYAEGMTAAELEHGLRDRGLFWADTHLAPGGTVRLTAKSKGKAPVTAFGSDLASAAANLFAMADGTHAEGCKSEEYNGCVETCPSLRAERAAESSELPTTKFRTLPPEVE